MDLRPLPPPNGKAYVYMSLDPDELARALGQSISRVAGFLGDINDDEARQHAIAMGREMFQVEDIELIEVKK